MPELREQLSRLDPDNLPTPEIAEQFAKHMKISDCLPEDMALRVARARLIDPPAVRRALAEMSIEPELQD